MACTHLSRDVLPILSEDAAAHQHLTGDKRHRGVSDTTGTKSEQEAGCGVQRSPVRNLLQVHLFVTVQQLCHIVTDDSHEEGDEDDGQDHPQPNAGVQQELGATHRPPSNLTHTKSYKSRQLYHLKYTHASPSQTVVYSWDR